MYIYKCSLMQQRGSSVWHLQGRKSLDCEHRHGISTHTVNNVKALEIPPVIWFSVLSFLASPQLSVWLCSALSFLRLHGTFVQHSGPCIPLCQQALAGAQQTQLSSAAAL